MGNGEPCFFFLAKVLVLSNSENSIVHPTVHMHRGKMHWIAYHFNSHGAATYWLCSILFVEVHQQEWGVHWGDKWHRLSARVSSWSHTIFFLKITLWKKYCTCTVNINLLYCNIYYKYKMIVVDDRKGVIFTVFNQKILLEVFAGSVFFCFLC